MSGLLLGRGKPAPPAPDPRPALEQFVARIRAELAEPGHITRAEIQDALDELDKTTRAARG